MWAVGCGLWAVGLGLGTRKCGLLGATSHGLSFETEVIVTVDRRS